MSVELQEKLEELKNCSFWMFDETLLFLTGQTARALDDLKVETRNPVDPSLEDKTVRMLATELGTYETKAYNIPFLEGKIYTLPKKTAELWISMGSAEELNESDTREWT